MLSCGFPEQATTMWRKKNGLLISNKLPVGDNTLLNVILLLVLSISGPLIRATGERPW
jgi:hypothetical protein